MFALMNCVELLGKLSLEMSVFQLWYLPSRMSVIGDREGLLPKAAWALFPGLEDMERAQRIVLGQKAINEKWVKEIYGES